jgi:hypothetical protein
MNKKEKEREERYRLKIQKYCDEREFELFYICDEPYISAFDMVKYTNHKNSQDMIMDFLDKNKIWIVNPTVIPRDILDDAGNFTTKYFIPLDQAKSFLELYQAFYYCECEADITMKPLLEEPKKHKEVVEIQIKPINLVDWLNKYNIDYEIMNNKIYVYTSDLVKYTKSRYVYSVWTKMGDVKLVHGAKSNKRENHMMVRIGDAIKCLKKYGVIKEFPEVERQVVLNVINETGKNIPEFSIYETRQIDDTLCILIKIIEESHDEHRRIV